ncbi:uncharacterized protein LOC112564144 [Pomacea canaliculata]|uniref:uncharacterized protein LOC112564144 n=1 Tax=Pomacea canaliculata TaxID=400727 RepID=UPI000D7360CA|nr:uncharacterized protein LOC112564144 [Pomacea canaliculata]
MFCGRASIWIKVLDLHINTCFFLSFFLLLACSRMKVSIVILLGLLTMASVTSVQVNVLADLALKLKLKVKLGNCIVKCPKILGPVNKHLCRQACCLLFAVLCIG